MGYNSRVWSVLFWVGAVATLVAQTITDPADYGLSPVAVRWIGLIGAALGLVGGKLGQSYLSKAGQDDKVDVRKLGTLLVIAALALGASGCSAKAPRHQTVIALTGTVTALRALQDGEHTLYAAHTLPALTAERHAAFTSKMLEVWTAVDDAVFAVEAWRPGQQTPASLAALIAKVSTLLTDAATVLGVALPAQVAAVWREIVALLQVIGGAA